MRQEKLIGSVVLVLLGASFSILAPGCVNENEVLNESGVEWLTSYDGALNLSRESGKPVMICFWAVWCSACEKYSHETFSDPVVVKTLEEGFIIPLTIDVDNDQDGIASMYGVRSIPTTLIVDSDGNVLNRWVGSVPPDMLIPILHNVSAMET